MGANPNGGPRSGDGESTAKTGKRSFLKLLGASAGALTLGGVGTAGAQSGGESRAHRLDITGVNDQSANYRFEALNVVPDEGTVEQWDAVTGESVDGWVPGAGGTDTYYFDGGLSGLYEFEFVEGEGRVTVDGRVVDPAAVSADTEHSVSIVGRGEPTNYALETSGSLEAAPGTKEQWDRTSDLDPVGQPTRVDGWVTSVGSVDTYYFDGEVERLEFEQGVADVVVDTLPVDDPESLTNDLDKYVIEIRGEGSPANYAFSVSGELHTSTTHNERWDSVSGSSAEGWVTDTSDWYTFTGEVTDFEFERGSATVEESRYREPRADE